MADLDIKDNSGSTPLHSACVWRNKEIVKLLAEKGANIETRDKKVMRSLGIKTK